MTNRTTQICSLDTLDAELRQLKDKFKQNGYSDHFIDKYIQQKQWDKVSTVDQKPVYISLPYRGEALADLAKHKLNGTVRKAYNATQPRIRFTSSTLLCTSLKERLPAVTTSDYIHSFTCSCGEFDIGRTTRRLADRIPEHKPTCLTKCETKNATSSILTHLVNSGHQVNNETNFLPIYRVYNKGAKCVGNRLLAVAEAISIRLENPKLCVQK